MAACPIVMAQDSHEDYFDFIEVLFYSIDGQYAAVKTTSSTDGVGGPTIPGSKLLVYDISEKRVIQSIDFTKFAMLGGDDDEKIRKENEELMQYALESVFIIGIDIEAVNSVLPENIELTARARPLDEYGERYGMTFFPNHFETGHTLDVEEVETWLPGASAKAMVMGIYPFPNNDGYIVVCRVPPRMEFDPGRPFLVALDSTVMAEFYNGIGFAFYKQKAYDAALDHFLESHRYDPWYAKAPFNVACMYALRGETDGSIKFINVLYDLREQEGPWQLLRQLDTDSDFNGIRNNPRFKALMDKLRPELKGPPPPTGP